MATGITGGERLDSVNAITASSLSASTSEIQVEEHPLVFDYPGKMPKEDVLALTPAACRKYADGKFAAQCEPVIHNAFCLGENLSVMLDILSAYRGSVQLIYLDPPFQTGMEFHTRGLENAYMDVMNRTAYVEFIRRRLIVMHELLTSSGSLYLHIGHQMLFHLKVVLDEIFGPSNFRNLIVRRKCSSKNYTRNQYPNLHDYILFYTKSKEYKWNQPKIAASDDWIMREYPYVAKDGRRYKLVPVHAPGVRHGETGKAWRAIMPPAGKHWQYTPSKLDELDRRGEIHWSKNDNPRRMVFLATEKLVSRTDYWHDMRDAHHQSVRVTGYPTEKNLSMLKCIVESGTDRDDIVLDPFCGSGTTLQAARDTGRKWIGIDESVTALRAFLSRMREGAKPMGDYVSKNRKASSKAQGMLFNPSEMVPTADAFEPYSLYASEVFFPMHEALLIKEVGKF